MDEEFEALRPRLRRKAQQALRDPGLADDAVQETWIKIRQSRNVRQLQALSYSALASVIADLAKRRSREPPPTDQVRDWAADDDPSRGPDWNAMKLAVLHAIKALAPREREVVYLRFWREMTVKDVAATLNIGTESVKELQHRALQKLAQRLAYLHKTERFFDGRA